jgi:hypothetical protein
MSRRNEQEHARLWDDFNAWKREQGIFLEPLVSTEKQPVEFAEEDVSYRRQASN